MCLSHDALARIYYAHVHVCAGKDMEEKESGVGQRERKYHERKSGQEHELNAAAASANHTDMR